VGLHSILIPHSRFNKPTLNRCLTFADMCHSSGTVVGVYGCLTDISKQKWTEGFQKRKMLEAIELKRQQENFIDMTSHEMRNPLSAIVQCADMIGTSIADFGGEEEGDALVPREILNSFADAASTIAFCAQHQKRIIDDILTLSKLDSDLFFITPVEVRPLDVVNNALRMFDGELQNNDISLDVHIDSSFNDLNVDWLKFDPSRMLQVMINLITNAIKFTHTEQIRKISITASVSLKPPSSNSDMVYLERTNSRKQNTQENEWGDGEIVYLNVKVQDSGRGLDEHEQSLLFQRFSQASPRTHVQYGGSGLGLFISRELTELQGGQIGLSSVAGEGSTFAFYILARRCNAPDVPSATIIKPETRDGNQSHPLPRSHSPAPQPSVNHRSHTPNGPRKSLTMTSPIHVLIVEDNIINQKVLMKQLLHVGCVVHVANHGLEALNFLEKSTVSNTLPPHEKGIRCDIVLMDLEMPIMNGLTCIKEIRMREEDRRIKGRVPIIALTANARREQIEKAREAGVDSVVTKPFRIRELVPELKRWAGVGGKRNVCVGECAGSGSAREDVKGRNRIAVEKRMERRQVDRRSTGPV
jgi:signal transduction histidine kinase/AmiR/NasT family two-component response regulator